ncbi:hypothetical protein ACGFI9_31050 [Micromonospora sp. NPDC048930]|uniref:hypothetical protein n=1 Tax=Micromonospora sp. NPDC048930 TaxID=3364261 RepID=UPI0037155393
MTEHDDELLIDRAFSDFTSDLAPAVRAPGGVRDEVARRRRNRVVTLIVTTGLAVLLPAGAFMGTGRGQPDLAGTSTSPVPSETPASPTPSLSASATSVATVPGSTRSGSDRSITLAQLTGAPVAVPAWEWIGGAPGRCASGRVQLRPSGDVAAARVGVVTLVRSNLDDDPGLETAALLRCGYGAEQVVAFGRDDEGQIVTLGLVVATDRATPAIVRIARRSRGGVTVTVADTRDPEAQQRQERSYAWTGQRFTQVGGPRAFTPVTQPADLGLTVAEPVAQPVSGACDGQLREVSVTFTVRNHSSYSSGQFYLEWRGGAFLPNGSYDSPYWLDTPGDPASDGGYRALEGGESVQLTYSFKIDACVTDWGFTTDIRTDTPDPDDSNNHVTWRLRIQ